MNPPYFIRILQRIPKLDSSQKKTFTQALKSPVNPILSKLAPAVIEHSKWIHCQSDRLRKYGVINQRQRFYCNTCRKSLVCTWGTAYFYQNKPELWQSYLEAMLERDSIWRCSKEWGICVTTSLHFTSFMARIPVSEPCQEPRVEASSIPKCYSGYVWK